MPVIFSGPEVDLACTVIDFRRSFAHLGLPSFHFDCSFLYCPNFDGSNQLAIRFGCVADRIWDHGFPPRGLISNTYLFNICTKQTSCHRDVSFV